MVKRTRPILEAKNESIKRPRYATDSEKLSSEDILSLLRNQDVSILRQGLVTLKNQLHFTGGEPIPEPQDNRLEVAKSWLEKSPGAEGVFHILRTSLKDPVFLQLCFDILANLLYLLSTHFIYHPFGVAILKALLSPANLNILNSNISDGSQEVILSGLRLFNAMSAFAGGAEKRAIMDGFTWGQKSRQKLFFLRRKSKGSPPRDLFDKPDIRTLYINFILSFLTKATPTPIKVTFLEQHKDVFLSIFKGIDKDPYHVIRHILETSWDGIWNDNKLRRTVKIALFQERTLGHLIKLYDREEPENDSDESIPANVVHHFLLAIMTHPGFGICFRDRGWYPREESEGSAYDKDGQEEDITERSGGKIYNKILFNILKSLKVNENPRQQELVYKILQACPELVGGYWTNVNLTLEPRLSSRWITNISILGTVVSFPIPVESFNLTNSVQIHPTPPPLRICMSSILPTVLNRTYLTRGLQSTSALVKHCTALTLIKCLMKLSQVMSTFRKNSLMLEEDRTSGQWIRRAQDLQREAERRVPDIMVIIGMTQQKQGSNKANLVLLSECAVRLLWLYQKLFPRLFSEIKFDTGKLLEQALEAPHTTCGPHDIIYQFSVLRFLMENEQFAGTSKIGSSHSALYALLLLHARSKCWAIRDIAAALLNKILSSSILFMHDPSELSLWLQAFPHTERKIDAKTEDGIPLLDEVTAVLGFLDDCLQRCSKTPYKYIEDLGAMFRKQDGHDIDFITLPSPLLAAVLEQYEAKIAAKLLNPSDTIALTAFIRKLGVGLCTKFSSLDEARIIQRKFEALLPRSMSISDSATFQASLRRECELFLGIIGFIENPTSRATYVAETTAQLGGFRFLNSDCCSDEESCYKAYEIVDRLRLVNSTLSNDFIKELVEIAFNLHPPACAEFCYYLSPMSNAFPECTATSKGILNMLPFELCNIYLNTDHLNLEDVARLSVCFYSSHSWNKSFSRRFAITLHRLAFNLNAHLSCCTLLKFMKEIIDYGVKRSIVDVTAVAESLLVECDVMRDICYSTNLEQADIEALSDLVRIVIDPTNKASWESINSYCVFWTDSIRNTENMSLLLKALPWVPYMEPRIILKALDVVLQSLKNTPCDLASHLTQSILLTLMRQLDNPYVVEQLQSRIDGLLSLRLRIPGDTVDRLILLIFEAGLPTGYNGSTGLLISNPIRSTTFVAAVEQSKKQWSQKAAVKPIEDFQFMFLKLLENVERDSLAICVSFYKHIAAKSLFKDWLQQTPSPSSLSPGLVFCLYSFLDSSSYLEERPYLILPPLWSKALFTCIFQRSTPQRLRSVCLGSAKILLRNTPDRLLCSRTLAESIGPTDYDDFNAEVIELIGNLKSFTDPEIATSLELILEWILDWVMNQLSNEEITITARASITLSAPVLNGHKFKPSKVEQSVKSGIRNHLDIPDVLDLCAILIQSSDLKPMIINQLLQSIVQHSRLYLISNHNSLTKLLYALFRTHPVNTCQPSHVIPLLRLYGGTMALSDRRFLSIFQLYESQTRQSIASLFSRWSSSQISAPSQDILTAVLTLDPNGVFRICLSYPRGRRLNNQLPEDLPDDRETYDPLFLILMASQVVLMQTDISVPEWVQLFRTNVFSVVISALCSKDDDTRRICVATLGCLHNRLQATDMIEKDQVLYVLDILKNVLSQDDNIPRLPIFVVIFLANALRGIFYPSSFLYPLTSRFLLQRPEFDTTDVPLLYSLLFSTENVEWVKERTWMIRYLTQVMDDGDFSDWKILRRRHTWDLIASMWQASKPEEKPLRKSILELFANMTANQYAISSLVLRTQLVGWLEMQLMSGAPSLNELFSWLKIIENIVVTMNFQKAERSLKGTYGDSLVRCLKHVSAILGQTDAIGSCDTRQMLDLVYLTSGILLRISEKESNHSRHKYLLEVAESISETLFSLESLLKWPPNESSHHSHVLQEPLSPPPHKASGVYIFPKLNESELSQDTHNCKCWALSIISLWRVALTAAISPTVLWDELTYRCLMVYSLGVIPSDSAENATLEWIRRMTLECTEM